MDWIISNKEWLFSGFGLVAIGWLGKFLLYSRNKEANATNINQTVVIGNNHLASANLTTKPPLCHSFSLADRKPITKILFIDDDTKFKVVKILSKSGWTNTSIIKDAITLEDSSIVNANILFVDVQGVGLAMGFENEGLGLAQALKEKYPEKKIVIYSAETNGDRFHSALRKADSFLPKNADPYEFQKLVEELSAEVHFN